MQSVENLVYLVLLIILVAVVWFFTKRFTTKSVCPTCGNIHDLERIKSAAIYKSIPLVNAKHFICYKCNKTHYRFSFENEARLVKSKV